MWRGTTPTHTFTIPDEVHISDYDTIYITYSQNGRTIVEKNEEDIRIEDNKLRLTFTQADTLLFSPGQVKIQLRAKSASGQAIASNIISTTAREILKDGEI